MGFLASVLPGLREARTPFIVGALWVAAILVAVPLFPDALLQSNFATHVKQVIGGLPSTIQLGALTFTAYLLGILTESLANGLTDALRAAPLVVRRLGVGRSPFRDLRAATTRRRLGPGAAGVVMDAMRDRFPRASEEKRHQLASAVLADFDLAARRLNGDEKESARHGEYSRLIAEAELRAGISLPLLLMVCLAGIQLPPGQGLVLSAVGLVASALLILQGAGRRQEADRYLAQAIYLRWTSTPLLEQLEAELKAPRAEAFAADDVIMTHLLDRDRL